MEAILGAAARILTSRGWSALTTNHVATRAGVSIGTLYEYFPGKEALAAALVDRHVTRAEEQLDALATMLAVSVPSLPELARTIVSAMLALHEESPRLHRVLFEEVPHSPAMRARVRDLEARQAELLGALLARMPDVHARDPRLAARIVVDVLEAAVHRWACDPRGEPIARELLLEELARLVIGYLDRE